MTLPRYIIRPPTITTTPRRLRELFSCTRMINPARVSKTIPRLKLIPDWNRDFFLYYPEDLLSRNICYEVLRDFQYRNKLHQRNYLHNCDIKTPEDYQPHEGKYVHRPMRHHSGQGWRVDNSITGNPGEYSAPLFPKRHEYRLLYSRGVLISTLKKRLSEGSIAVDRPWNHYNGSVFVTVNDPENDRLRHTTVYDDVSRCPVVQHGHLLGVDVMYGKPEGKPDYACLEINLCPAMSIDTNLQKLKELWT